MSLNGFNFESVEQEKGYLAYLSWMIKTPKHLQIDGGDKLRMTVAYLIQKHHESNQYWRDTVATQVKLLEDEILSLRAEIEALHQKIQPNQD